MVIRIIDRNHRGAQLSKSVAHRPSLNEAPPSAVAAYRERWVQQGKGLEGGFPPPLDGIAPPPSQQSQPLLRLTNGRVNQTVPPGNGPR